MRRKPYQAQALPQPDETTQQNYAEWNADGNTYKIWLEDESSLEAKLKVMKEYDLAGAAEWKIGFEKDGIWELIASTSKDNEDTTKYRFLCTVVQGEKRAARWEVLPGRRLLLFKEVCLRELPRNLGKTDISYKQYSYIFLRAWKYRGVSVWVIR